MDVTEALCNNLCESGIDASINPEKKSLLSQLKPFGAKSIAKITIRGRQVAGIELFGHYRSPNEKRFGAGARSTLEAVDVDYILRADIKDKKKLLKAKLHVKRTGLVHRKVVEMRWDGGTLANKLNSDSTVTELLWQSLGKLSARDIEVNLDEDGGIAIIHVSDDRHVLSNKLPPFQLYEKIAEHIYALTGTQKSVQSLSPREVSAAEAAPKPPENKYCPKCGGNIPLDSSFCPICGATIEATTAPAPPPGHPEPPEVSFPPKAVVAEPVPPPKQPEPPEVSLPPKATPPPSPVSKQRKVSKSTAPQEAVAAEPPPPPKQPETHMETPHQVATPPAPASKQRKASKAIATPKAVVAKPGPAPKQPEPPVIIPTREAVTESSLGDIVCKKCGGVNPASASLCRKCGSKLAVVPVPTVAPKQSEAPVAVHPGEAVTPARSGNIICKKCGGVNPADANICRKCGSRLAVAPSSAAMPRQTEPPVTVPHSSVVSRCSKCGHQNQAGANFCARCGAKIETVSRSKFCPRCGDPVAEDENFCDKCGKKLA